MNPQITKVFATIKKYKLLLLLFISGMMFLYLHYTYRQTVSVAAEREIESIQNNLVEFKSTPLTKDTTVSQSFLSPNDQITSLSIKFDVSESVNESNIEVSLREEQSGALVQNWNIKSSDLSNLTFYSFSLNSPIQDAKGKQFQIQITSDAAINDENAVFILYSKENFYPYGSLTVNGKEQSEDLIFNIFAGKADFVKTVYIAACFLFFLMLLFLFYILYIKQWKIEKVFLVTGLFLGIFYIFVLPPYAVPDEARHINTSFYDANRLTFQDAVDADGKTVVRNEDLLVSDDASRPHLDIYSLIYNNLFEASRNDSLTAMDKPPLSSNTLMSHLPQTLGVIVSRILNLGNVPTLILGSLFGLCFYLFCCYYGLKFMPFGKPAFFAITLLPITIDLGASFSYDLIINGLSFFFVGYCLYLAFDTEKEKMGWKDYALLTVTLAILSPIKVIYALLGLLIFLIPKKKAANSKTYYIASAVILGGAFLTILFTKLSTISTMIGSDNNTLWFSGKQGYTMALLLEQPKDVIRLLVQTFKMQLDFYTQSLFGGLLGWLEIEIPWFIVIGFIFIIVLGSIHVCKEKNSSIFLKMPQKLWCGIICAGITGGTMLALLLDWTYVGSEFIQGVQGRYFLPFLPLLIVLLRTPTLKLTKKIDSGLILALFLLHVITLVSVFEIIILR